ncbi:MAG: right-handed parallel beta-helix repeat-containing protein [Rhizobiaceae bacterium]|nr:right-handed parallel beta-helix repeat-containing protein [Rhizobiaceae bacterium]
MKNLILSTILIATSLSFGASHSSAEVNQCTEITSVPAVINVQGVYCLKGNLTTSMTSGAAIRINTNNVTIELNGWKLGGSAAGLATNASGIYADDRKNITIRNGTIRGFRTGIGIDGSAASSSGHLIEDMLVNGNRAAGIRVSGNNNTIRNNRITNTGPSSLTLSATGIEISSGKNISIYGNTVSGLNSASAVAGIKMNYVANVEVRDNRIFDLLNGNSKEGITSGNVHRLTIRNNTVTTENGGFNSSGIKNLASSQAVACVGNIVNGFANNIGGCHALVGNVSF